MDRSALLVDLEEDSYYYDGGQMTPGENMSNCEKHYCIEMVFSNDEDYVESRNFLTDICLIKSPSLDQEYKFIENIGIGSQATVDLFASLPKKGPLPSSAVLI
jgi:hypothetical protein